MNVSSIAARPVDWSGVGETNRPQAPKADQKDNQKTREAFDEFVGQTFFGQLTKAMRSSVGKPAYFHGGRTEEIFQSQLDQVLTERMTEATANTFSSPMFDLFMLRRQ